MRWLTSTEFCAIYQVSPESMRKMIDAKILSGLKTSEQGHWRIADPGQQYMAIYLEDPRYFPWIRLREAAAMLGLTEMGLKWQIEKGVVPRRTKQHPHFSIKEIEKAYRDIYKSYGSGEHIRPAVMKWATEQLEKTVGKIERPPEIQKLVDKPIVKPKRKAKVLSAYQYNRKKFG